MNEDKMELEEAIRELQERIEMLNRHIKNYEESNCKTNIYLQLVKERQAIETVLQELENKEKEIGKLYTIRNEVDYGYENIHIITKNRLATIEKNKYLIEIEDGKVVDIKELYENSIPKMLRKKLKKW